MLNPALRTYPLLDLLPAEGSVADADNILQNFLQYIEQHTSLQLYPAQEEAILELVNFHNVILNTPTGSGKSLVALFMHFLSLSRGRRSFYTAPIKALVNEKFLDLCGKFGPQQVGLMTGDGSVNPQASIICCTAEILMNMALREGERTPVQDVIIDEFHFFADRERGVAWQVPLLTLPHCRFLLMSATMGETQSFAQRISQLTQAPTIVVTSNTRPVPLFFRYSDYPLESTLENLVQSGQAPVYVVHFTQRECAQTSQALLSSNYASKEEKQKIAQIMEGETFRTPYGKDINRLLRHGVGIHHAGLLPKYRLLVEKLAKEGLLKVICGTDTLGVGVNIPIKTVLFTKLCKFDGEKTTLLSARDFHQIAGRAGRKGYDDRGSVVVMAPEHVIENKKIQGKAQQNPQKAKKMVKAKPPERGYIPWDEATFIKLQDSPPEALASSFRVSHGMLLNVLGRPHQGLRAMKKLIDESFESAKSQRKLKQESLLLLRSLVQRKIIEFIPQHERKKMPSTEKTLLRVNVDLQEDFSLDHALSLYLLDTLDLIDPYHEDFPLQVLTLTESIVENPKAILLKQVDKAKGLLIQELKEQGMEYEERMEALEKVEHPKPMQEFIYNTFNDFAALHPWVGQENIRPKSIAREMWENFYSFSDYIREYGLERSEGILLRHLMEVYRVLTQTVPEKLKMEPLMEGIIFIESLIRQADSGILDEWEKLKDPLQFAQKQELAREQEEKRKVDLGILYDLKIFSQLVRNAVMLSLRSLTYGQWEHFALALDNPEDWPQSRLENLLQEYKATHGQILLTPDARNKKNTLITQEFPQQSIGTWQVQQVLVDSEGLNDWEMILQVDLPLSRELRRPHLKFLDLREIDR